MTFNRQSLWHSLVFSWIIMPWAWPDTKVRKVHWLIMGELLLRQNPQKMALQNRILNKYLTKSYFSSLNDYKKISVWYCVSEICPLLLPYIYYHNSSIFIFWYEYDFGETTICKQKKLVIHFMKKPVAFCPLLCPKCMKTSPAWNDRQVNHNSRRDGESSNSRFES